jgi:competence protein ComEC
VTANAFLRARPHAYLGALCGGVGAANAVRPPLVALAATAVAVAAGAAAAAPDARRWLAALALVLLGLAWGTARLDALDVSPLGRAVDTAGLARVIVTAPARHSRFQLRVPVQVARFADERLREPALLELPVGRAPPQGAIIDLVATVRRPRPVAEGFDERRWLGRHGMHVVLTADSWRLVGRRGGLGGITDRVRRRLAETVSPGLAGERRALVQGVVLGDDDGLTDELRADFRVSGLYHLLAVSGQNVALVAGGALATAWLIGLPRLAGQLAALAAVVGYVLAVGPQPSVVRAGIAGVLGTLAWLSSRQTDRWYFLLVGAFALLAWNPYTLFDAGFQLSFAAVGAIFVVAPWLSEVLEGYPLPRPVRSVVAISTACGVVTAPILWLQFGTVPLLSVPANAIADPIVVPLLALAGLAAALAPVAPGAAAAAAWLNGWCAAYLAGCARVVAAVPFAQAQGAAAGLVSIGGLVGTAYAWRRWRVPR